VIQIAEKLGLKGATFASQGHCKSPCLTGVFAKPMQITAYFQGKLRSQSPTESFKA
jgi:hypothetical protein